LASWVRRITFCWENSTAISDAPRPPAVDVGRLKVVAGCQGARDTERTIIDDRGGGGGRSGIPSGDGTEG